MNKKNKNREDGSAIILAILVLAFFMALSMNMFFLAQKKSERAGVKARGVKVLSNIDGGASMGYYELSRASNFVTEGVVRRNTDGTTRTAISVTISAISTNAISVQEGVVLEKYQQYFGGFIDSTTGSVVLAEVTTGNSMWFNQFTGEAGTTSIIELWTTSNDNMASIGGFRIKRTNGNRELRLNGTQQNQIPAGEDLKGDTIVVTYIKELTIPEGNLNYSIECTREVVYDSSGNVDSDDLTEIVVLFR